MMLRGDFFFFYNMIAVVVLERDLAQRFTVIDLSANY